MKEKKTGRSKGMNYRGYFGLSSPKSQPEEALYRFRMVVHIFYLLASHF